MPYSSWSKVNPAIKGIKPKGSKEARVLAVVPLIEAGNVILPHPREAGWVGDFIEECLVFPFGNNDDQVDAMSQALSKKKLQAFASK